MPKDTVSFRTDHHIREAVDTIAKVLDRDRSYVINQALAAFIEAHHWQIEHIQNSESEAESGLFAADMEVARESSKWRNSTT